MEDCTASTSSFSSASSKGALGEPVARRRSSWMSHPAGAGSPDRHRRSCARRRCPAPPALEQVGHGERVVLVAVPEQDVQQGEQFFRLTGGAGHGITSTITAVYGTEGGGGTLVALRAPAAGRSPPGAVAGVGAVSAQGADQRHCRQRNQGGAACPQGCRSAGVALPEGLQSQGQADGKGEDPAEDRQREEEIRASLPASVLAGGSLGLR